jgi:hypothetical protein
LLFWPFIGGFGPGLWRYYSAYKNGSGLSASQIAEKANSQSGSPFVWFKVKKLFMGLFTQRFAVTFISGEKKG